jgi:hypothetical protein
MSVKLAMVSVNKSALIQLDHLSAHVIRALVCHLIVQTVLVSIFILCDSTWLRQKLSDVNECQTSNGGCEQVCTNTVGSFECSCNRGYSLASAGLLCIGKLEFTWRHYISSIAYLSATDNYCYVSDINECETINGGCQHNCSNRVGSFQCSCLPGYSLNGDGLQCSGEICAVLWWWSTYHRTILLILLSRYQWVFKWWRCLWA